MESVDVFAFADLEEGKLTSVSAHGQEVVLVRRGDRVRAIQRRCPHMGADLGAGTALGDLLVCPRHKAAFDLNTGETIDPARLLFLKFRTRNATAFAVEVANGRVLVGKAAPNTQS